MSLDALLTTPPPSYFLRQNHFGMGHKEWIEALTSDPPITLDISHIRKYHSQCRVSGLIFKQLKNGSAPAGSYLQVYSCEDLHGGLQSGSVGVVEALEAHVWHSLLAFSPRYALGVEAVDIVEMFAGMALKSSATIPKLSPLTTATQLGSERWVVAK
jgi:hypothetical protein